LGKFSEYIVPLRGLKDSDQRFEYKLTNDFFIKIDSPEVGKGKLDAVLNVKKIGESFELNFVIEGVAQVPCDRCLDDVSIPVTTQETIYVKFGKDFSEEDGNVVIVPFEEGEINVAWFIFEFIALSIPMKHVHPYGKCNKAMSSKLKQVSAYEKDDDEGDNDMSSDIDFDDDDNQTTTDPRWDGLKKLNNNSEEL
jgi:uncharacterized metal-binding protein YceD (DUF177 family)